jgi:DNA-binding Lrp family transcriptional regulator
LVGRCAEMEQATKAFILAQCGIDINLETIIEEIRELHGVNEAYLMYGPYDLLVKSATENTRELAALIRTLGTKGVVTTTTFIVDKNLGLSFEKDNSDKIRKCAYVFIKVQQVAEISKLEKPLKDEKLPILEAHSVFGRYDVIISIEEAARSKMFSQVTKYLRSLEGITSCDTLFTVEEV